LTPESLRAKLDRAFAPLPLAELGYSIYADYQRALAYRGAVDFDDLIRLALTLLQSDDEYLERLRFRYPFILEDEAQDSSLSQQKILELLSAGRVGRGDSRDHIETTSSFETSGLDTLRYSTSGVGGNWVRVGDPNQAIFETFTTADPDLLRNFIATNPNADMPESGRSQPSIINLANHLINWVMNSHPEPQARTALSLPEIKPVPQGYEPQNPPDNPEGIKLIGKKFTPEEELENVAKSVKSYLDSFGEEDVKPTIAILVPRNTRGVEVIEALKKRNVEVIELISSTSNTRAAAGSLNYLLSYLADPQSARKLSKAYEVWRRDWREEVEKAEFVKVVSSLIQRIGQVENFVAPNVSQDNESDWLATISADEAEQIIEELKEFRVNVQRWLNAVTLPIDQLVLTLAQDVFTEAPDLALAHKLALVLRKAADDHNDWRLPELTAELAVIAKNERRFIGFSEDDSGFDPEHHRGKVVVTTMHRAKGLEWDRVYLMSVNNYDFPSGMPNDKFISEKWFIRQGLVSIRSASGTQNYSTTLNMEAEALAQLDVLGSRYGDDGRVGQSPYQDLSPTRPPSEYDWYEEGKATFDSRLGYIKERLRLFYVGITRAKRELIVTWNSGRQGDATPSLALSELMGWWESESNG
jgi:DNA helicase-2/ATP-dependent DNA helicase PcrA